MFPQVDVIILSWDRVAETIAAIESAAAQTGVAKRILILDQGSAPENLVQLRRAVAGRPEIVLQEWGRNVGVAQGRNLASAMGAAPYIVALDNDAVFPNSRTLERVVQRLDDEPNLGAIGFRIINFFTGRDDAMCWDYPGMPPAMAEREFMATRFIGAGHALRREAFEEAGGYDAALFFAGEERDLGYRILNLGYRIRYSPDFAVLHKVDPTARVNWKSGRYYYTVRNALYTDYKFGASPWLLARAAAALTLKGLRNGIAGQALRGVRDAARMAFKFPRHALETRVYRLNSEVRDYIQMCEHRGQEPVLAKIRRQFDRLPERV
ncbi:MAG TPA: glycosyltransferase [Alphaproteobacteria bacterium]|jgi:GT2 family glycosyltransferase